MAHLFNKHEYYDYRGKACANIKKTLDSKIDYLVDGFANQLHTFDINEQVVLDGVQYHFTYNQEQLHFPVKLLEVDDLSEIINIQVIKQNFDQEEIQELLSYLPHHNINELSSVLVSKGLFENHLLGFQRKLKNGYFTTFRQKQDEINEKLSQFRLKQIYQSLLKAIINQKTQGVKKQKVYLEDEGSSAQSLNELSQIEQMSDNSQATETEQEMDNMIDQEFTNRVFFKYDYSKIKGQEELLALGQDKGDKKAAMYKITLPMRPRNNEWVQNYRKQEFLRYSNPTKAWTYNCEDGRKVTVAPVAKKISVLTGKPRDHPLLKNQRPACVTILTLVRDAAARLPNGVGTRADISELLKQSQYVNEDLPEQKLSNIVSGALDRLHYMSDACVKYDSEKKLWIYLHGQRNYEHPGWGEDGEQYIEKNNNKKKKKDLEA